MEKRRFFRLRRNFLLCIWSIVFAYFSISAELKYSSVAAEDEFNLSTEKPNSYSTRTVAQKFNLPRESSESDETESEELEELIEELYDGQEGVFNEMPGVNCTPPGIDDFPRDFFTQRQRRHGFVIIHFFVSLYIFYALAIVCDDYFVPSVERICEDLNIPSDVAGATFMAIATSAPELFTNIIGTFITHGDVGIGTIVGSAVFNILAVAALCGLGAGMLVPLEWWSVSRDCFCYLLSVVLLLLVLRDEKIYWYEALVLVLVYSFYILAMYKNSSLKKGAEKFVLSFEKKLDNGKSETTYEIAKGSESSERKACLNGNGNGGLGFEHPTNDAELSKGLQLDTHVEMEKKEQDEEEYEFQFCSPPKGEGCKTWFEWIIGWPIKFFFFLTIPDCQKDHLQKYYPLTFMMCIMWIGVLSYFVNWMMTIIGHTLQIPDSVMGLTFIAAGTSVPEVVSSVIVARRGLGTMALSSSIGSNTFDILICLGLPWLIRSSMLASTETDYIKVNSTGLEYSTMMLISALIVLYSILACNKFVLDRKVGFIALLLYIMFLVMASLFELNVFFTVNLPTCVKHLD